MAKSRSNVIGIAVLFMGVAFAGCTSSTPPATNGGVDFGDGTDSGDGSTGNGTGTGGDTGTGNQTGGGTDGGNETGDDGNTTVPRFELTAPTIGVVDATGNTTNSVAVREDVNISATFADANISAHIVNYVWRLGDGNVKNGSNIMHSYLSPGRRVVNLTVEDAFGRNASSEAVIGVRHEETFTGTLTIAYVQGGDAENGRSYRRHSFNVTDGAVVAEIRLSYEPGVTTTENLDLFIFAPNQTDEAVASGAKPAGQPESLTLDSSILLSTGQYAAEVRLVAGAAVDYTLRVTIEYV
ncbi:MAG: PKD domain-containing protein [Euryarchaeota archaeon]|nr:PKD domain-containing protein [Euryarchaeota archaeon]